MRRGAIVTSFLKNVRGRSPRCHSSHQVQSAVEMTSTVMRKLYRLAQSTQLKSVCFNEHARRKFD